MVDEEEFKFSDLKKLKFIFYLLLLQMIIMDGAFMSFMANSNEFLNARFGFKPDNAGVLVSLIYIAGLLISPIFGYISGRYGRRITLLALAILFFMIS